jgi:hypothetical protein
MEIAKDLKVRTERLETMRAAHIHVLSETPEEEAWKKMVAWAKPKGLLEKGIRVFGRNTYPTDNPHGYEFFLTVGWNIEPDGDIDMREIPAGYMRFFDSKIWKTLEMPGNIYGTG